MAIYDLQLFRAQVNAPERFMISIRPSNLGAGSAAFKNFNEADMLAFVTQRLGLPQDCLAPLFAEGSDDPAQFIPNFEVSDEDATFLGWKGEKA